MMLKKANNKFISGSFRKKLMAMILSSTMALGCISVPVMAGDTQTGNIYGVECSGKVYFNYTAAGDCNGASATTTFSGGGELYAEVKLCYKLFINKSSSASNTSSGGGVTATVTHDGLGKIYGAVGSHKVKSGSYTWEPLKTTIGETW